ncbi:MAG: hypothetical protein KGD63_04140 [Candidatus Lokiarchaeota archaeon]|nr:hypothetical protein [Candidatus Lokiarchaeota archaeon]
MQSDNENKIKNLISCGKYQKAFDIINSIDEKRSLSEYEYLWKNYLLSFIHLDKGEFQKGVIQADIMIKESKSKLNILGEIDGYIAKIENIILLAYFNEGFQLIKEAELILKKASNLQFKEISQRKAYLIYLKGRIYQEKHEIIKGIIYFKESYSISKNINEKSGMVWSLHNLGILTLGIGEFEEGEKYLKASLRYSEEFDIEMAVIWNLIHLGWIKFHLRDLNSLLDYVKKSITICKSKNYKYVLTNCYDLIGHYHLIKGKLDKALSYFKKSLKLREQRGYLNLLPQSYYCIGEVYSQKGKLRESLVYYQKAMDSPIIEMKEFYKPIYLSTMGKIYGELGEFDISKKYLLTSLDLLKEKKMYIMLFQNFSISYAKTFHYLITLSIQNNEGENIDIYLKELHKISIENPDFKYISHIYNLDKAIVLKQSSRVRNQMKAGMIFKKISIEEIDDVELKIEAMINLCEVLIYELELTGREEILKEIENLSDEMLKIARSQYLYNLLVETYLFKAKIALLKLDINKTYEMLSKGQKIALEYNLTLLLRKISDEYDSLLINKDKWESIIKKQIPLQERVNYSRYEFLFSKMVRSKISTTKEKSERPIYLVVLNMSNGYCIYDRNFQDKKNIDGNLIAGFLSAINLFGKKAFSSSKSINLIKHGEFFIIIEPKEGYLFSYVFIGHSYLAKTKINSFINTLLKSDKKIIRKLNMLIKSHRDISEEIKMEIDQKVDLIFLSKKIINT